MSLSPTALTLRELRARAILCDVAEHWNPYGKVRVDLFGFIDVVALDPNRPAVVGIQSTTATNLSARRKKIKGPRAEKAEAWLRAGGAIEIWAWRLKKLKRGGTAVRWVVNVEEIRLGDVVPLRGLK